MYSAFKGFYKRLGDAETYKEALLICARRGGDLIFGPEGFMAPSRADLMNCDKILRVRHRVEWFDGVEAGTLAKELALVPGSSKLVDYDDNYLEFLEEKRES